MYLSGKCTVLQYLLKNLGLHENSTKISYQMLRNFICGPQVFSPSSQRKLETQLSYTKYLSGKFTFRAIMSGYIA